MSAYKFITGSDPEPIKWEEVAVDRRYAGEVHLPGRDGSAKPDGTVDVMVGPDGKASWRGIGANWWDLWPSGLFGYQKSAMKKVEELACTGREEWARKMIGDLFRFSKPPAFDMQGELDMTRTALPGKDMASVEFSNMCYSHFIDSRNHSGDLFKSGGRIAFRYEGCSVFHLGEHKNGGTYPVAPTLSKAEALLWVAGGGRPMDFGYESDSRVVDLVETFRVMHSRVAPAPVQETVEAASPELNPYDDAPGE